MATIQLIHRVHLPVETIRSVMVEMAVEKEEVMVRLMEMERVLVEKGKEKAMGLVMENLEFGSTTRFFQNIIRM